MQAPSSPHTQRRGGLAFFLYAAAPWLTFALAALAMGRRLGRLLGGSRPKPGVTVFQSYMVGDLFMALPALKALREALQAASRQTGAAPDSSETLPLQIICRPDCVAILQSEGFTAIGLRHDAFTRNSWAAFWTSLRGAWALRREATTFALDTDADPRTALLLRIMGCGVCVTYAREHALFFSARFALPGAPAHQVEKNLAVIRGFCDYLKSQETSGVRPLRMTSSVVTGDIASASSRDRSSLQPSEKSALRVWVMAVTRKDTKNWPLGHWDVVLERLTARGVDCVLVDVPDGGEAWRGFVDVWRKRVPVLSLPLPDLWVALSEATHVIALDNFLGHMAAYAGKQVLWLNGSSDASQVAPVRVEPDDGIDAGSRLGWRAEVVQIEPMPCRPCGHRCTEARHAHCLTDLDVNSVWARVAVFLRLPS
jgi:ADP-heptose:LPS heptosyltransferase